MKYLRKIKPFLLSTLLSALGRAFKFGKVRQPLTLMLLAGLGLMSALLLPAVSQPEVMSEPQLLAQQGRDFYQAGQLEQAISTWEKAVNLYEQAGDDERRAANLINTATAQQLLGLYEQSCVSVLKAFKIPTQVSQTDLTAPSVNLCLQLIEDAQSLEQNLQDTSQPKNFFPEADSSFAFLQPLVDRPYNLSQTLGLLRLGDYFINSNYPQVALAANDLSLQIAQELDNTSQKTAAFLSLGNTVSAIALKEQNRFSPQTTALNIIRATQFSGEADLAPEIKALQPYQKAIDYYQKAAKSAQSPLNRLKAETNHLSMLLDIREFWQTAIKELPDSNDEFQKLFGVSDRIFIQKTIENKSKLKSGLEKELQPQINYLTETIHTELRNLPPEISLTHFGVFARINFAQSLIRQGIYNTETDEILKNAVDDALQLKSPIVAAEAYGNLGYFYEQQQQYQQARNYTVEALTLAPTNNYPETAYRWHAQLGRILAQQNDREAALAAYKASFQTINTLRSDLATTSVDKIFREYITLLGNSREKIIPKLN